MKVIFLVQTSYRVECSSKRKIEQIMKYLRDDEKVLTADYLIVEEEEE